MILCMGERAYFPASEFRHDKDKHLIHIVQEAGTSCDHYQATGDPVQSSPVEPVRLKDDQQALTAYQNPDITWTSFPAQPAALTPEGYQKVLQDAVGKLYQSQLDDLRAAQDAIRGSIKDAQENDSTALQAIHTAYLDVAKGQIDRSQARATQVVTAAGAIGTIYTAILAFHFSSSATPLPSIGIIPGIFLGAAVVFALIYLAYMSHYTHALRARKPSGITSFRVIEQRDNFILWANDIVSQRLPWLHASAVTLGLAVGFLPVAFLTFPQSSIWITAALGSVVDGAIVLLLWVYGRPGSLAEASPAAIAGILPVAPNTELE